MLEYTQIQGTALVSSRIALGTWAIGGWMWGGSDEKESIRTIHAALDNGIKLIGTPPSTATGVPKKLSAQPCANTAAGKASCLPRKSESTGRTAESSAIPRVGVFSRNSTIH